MKKATLVVTPFYFQNRIFDVLSSNNRDNCLVPFALLKKEMELNGFDLATQDVNPVSSSEIIIYLDVPDRLPDLQESQKSFLLIFESEVIKANNWDLKNHQNFKKIFTWNDSLIDNKKYFKLNVSVVFPEKVSWNVDKKKKFCCVISGNKQVTHELELYSKRVEAIKWFEKNHPELFDLYGVGWNEVPFRGRSVLERYSLTSPITRFIDCFTDKYKCYKGRVTNKFEVLSQYKFSICYENARDIPGYITEKIFDCFASGCIPVYWGANNITDHIPAECFVDKRKFSSYEELFYFLNALSAEQCAGYVQAMNGYINSSQSRQFSATWFARTIVTEVLRP